MQKINIILSGGGTGGHIFPAIALAEMFLSYEQKKSISIAILFVGACGKMEMQLVPQHGFNIFGLPIRGLDRRQWWKNFLLPDKVIRSLWQANNIIKKFQPHIVIGTGGYASVPILYLAAKKKIPTLIQEQNVFPGLANKWLSYYVDKVCLGFHEAEKFFPLKKSIFTGNPLRKLITQVDFAIKKEAYQNFGIDNQKKCVLVLGGSLGAKAINVVIFKNIELFFTENIQIIWQVGKHFYAEVDDRVKKYSKIVKIYPFITNMAQAYLMADIVVARGGALTIAEVCFFQKPTLFIPSPHVAADHQIKNVQVLVKHKAAIAIKDAVIEEQLIPKIFCLLHNDNQQKMMKRNLMHLSKPMACEDIVEEAFSLLEK